MKILLLLWLNYAPGAWTKQAMKGRIIFMLVIAVELLGGFGWSSVFFLAVPLIMWLHDKNLLHRSEIMHFMHVFEVITYKIDCEYAFDCCTWKNRTRPGIYITVVMAQTTIRIMIIILLVQKRLLRKKHINTLWSNFKCDIRISLSVEHFKVKLHTIKILR